MSLTPDNVVLPGEGDTMAAELVTGGPHDGEKLQAVYIAGADGSPTSDGGTWFGGTLTPTGAHVYAAGDQIADAQSGSFSGLKAGRYRLYIDLIDPEVACNDVAIHLFRTDPTSLGGDGTPFNPITEINPGGASNYSGVIGNFTAAPWGAGQTLFGDGMTTVVADNDDIYIVVVAGGAGTATGASAIITALAATYVGPLNL